MADSFTLSTEEQILISTWLVFKASQIHTGIKSQHFNSEDD